MKLLAKVCAISALTLAMLVCDFGTPAQIIAIQPIGSPFYLKKADGKSIQDMIEPSAVEPIGKAGNHLLIADDKDDGTGKSLAIVETKTGTVIKLLDNFQNSTRNPKWEAMAKDGGYFYVISSHGFDPGDNAAKLAARSRLIRFKLVNEAINNPAEFAVELNPAVIEFDIKESLEALGVYNPDPEKISLEKRVKIEGMAIRTLKGRKQLVIGFREPFDAKSRVQVYYADLPPENEIKPMTTLTLAPFFQFAAGRPNGSPVPFKLSSIEYIPELKGFIVLTSTEDGNNAFYGNALWFVRDADIEKSRQPNTKFSLDPVPLVNPGIFEPTMKAEGLAVLPTTVGSKIRLVIVYDNDPQSAHTDSLSHPSTMQCVEISSDVKTMSGVTC